MTEAELKTLAEETATAALAEYFTGRTLRFYASKSVSAILAALQRVQRAMQVERDNARANASILAHAYETDNRPPGAVVQESLAYPRHPALPSVEDAPRDGE